MRTTLVFPVLFSMLVTLALIAGCAREHSSSLPAAPTQWDDGAHVHAVHMCPSEGPHGGQLLEIGEGDYHAELIHDETRHLVGIYLLDANASAPVPIGQSSLMINLLVGGKPAQFRLPATPLDGEAGQHSSHFELLDEKLCEALDLPGTKPRFNVTIQGKQYVVPIENHDHKDDRIAQVL